MRSLIGARGGVLRVSSAAAALHDVHARRTDIFVVSANAGSASANSIYPGCDRRVATASRSLKKPPKIPRAPRPAYRANSVMLKSRNLGTSTSGTPDSSGRILADGPESSFGRFRPTWRKSPRYNRRVIALVLSTWIDRILVQRSRLAVCWSNRDFEKQNAWIPEVTSARSKMDDFR